MPNYNALSVADFKTRLKEGHYDSVTGARRAIGKMGGWSDAEKDSARKLADKHFGDAPAPKAAVKKVAKGAGKKAAAAPAGTQPKRRGRPPKAKKEEDSVEVAELFPSTTAEAPEETRIRKPGRGRKAAKPAETTDPMEGVNQALQTGKDAINSYTSAIESLRSCEGRGIDVQEGIGKALRGIETVIDFLQVTVVNPLQDRAGAPTPAEAQGAELFAKAAPTAVAPQVPALGALPRISADGGNSGLPRLNVPPPLPPTVDES